MKLKRVFYSVFFYVLVMVLLVVAKPKMMFQKDGEIKRYGVEPGETIFSLGVVSVVLAIVSFYIFAVIDFLFQQAAEEGIQNYLMNNAVAAAVASSSNVSPQPTPRLPLSPMNGGVRYYR